MKFGLRSLAAVMIAALGLVGVAGSTAEATVRAHNPSFVGTYTIHGDIAGTTDHLRGALTVNADGTATDQHGNVAHWQSSGKSFTLTYKAKGMSETFLGTQSKKGINSKKKPGTFTSNFGASGTWWAIRAN